MTNRRGILCAGCWTLDQIRVIDHWPEEENLAITSTIDQQGGGSAHNVSIDLKKLDPSFPVFTAGLLGNDFAGDYLYKQANDYGVDTTQLLRTSSASTSFTDVMTVESTGKRTFFHHAGANDLLTPDNFDVTSCSAELLHLGLLGVHKILDKPWQSDANAWVSILRKAKDAGMKTNIEMVSIDPERNRELALPCLPFLDSLIINDYEAGCLTELNTVENGRVNIDACRSAADALLAIGSMEVVIVHFPGGAVACDKTGVRITVPAFDVPSQNVVSTVGAGDAFAAGVLYSMLQDDTLPSCIETGHAVAAASLHSATTVGSVKSIEECVQAAGRLARKEL